MKQSQNKNFDQFVKGKLENASVEAPAFIWDKIERQLPPVLPWYSKYKYLLLLLLLSFFSTTSVVSYKYFKGKNAEKYALNNLSTENNISSPNGILYTSNTTDNTNNSNNTNNTNNDKVDNIQQNTSSRIEDRNNTDAASVSAFYQNQKSDNSSTKKSKTDASSTALEKRNKRINRFEINNNQVSTTNNKQTNTNNSTNSIENNTNTNSLITGENKTKNKIQKVSRKKGVDINNNNNTVDDKENNKTKTLAFTNSTSKNNQDVTTNNVTPKNSSGKKSKLKNKEITSGLNNASDNTLSNSKSNSKSNTTSNTTSNSSSNSSITNQNSDNNNSTDISPIAEPVRLKESEELLASATPLKLNTTPLKSRDVLRSLIEPNKLETLDFNAAVGVEDLNPNKEKMMRNLKQFAGYNINQGFHIGALISINNIWLSNKNFSKSENTSDIKPKIDFGKSYGLNIGYDYNDHWGIQLEAQYSEQGQKYTESSVSMNATKEINLNYLKFPLMVKYKQSFINNYNSKPIVMSFLFGPQMGFLLQKETLLNKQSIPTNQGYSKVETGLAAGIDFDLYMMRYMYLTIGARTGFGTSFKKGVPVSYQLGITTQFNFRVPKKIK